MTVREPEQVPARGPGQEQALVQVPEQERVPERVPVRGRAQALERALVPVPVPVRQPAEQPVLLRSPFPGRQEEARQGCLQQLRDLQEQSRPGWKLLGPQPR